MNIAFVFVSVFMIGALRLDQVDARQHLKGLQNDDETNNSLDIDTSVVRRLGKKSKKHSKQEGLNFPHYVHKKVFGKHSKDDLPQYTVTEMDEKEGNYEGQNADGDKFILEVNEIYLDSSYVGSKMKEEGDEDVINWSAKNNYVCYFVRGTIKGPRGKQDVIASVARTESMTNKCSVSVQEDPESLEVSDDDNDDDNRKRVLQQARNKDCRNDALKTAADFFACEAQGGELVVDDICSGQEFETFDERVAEAETTFDKAIEVANTAFKAAKAANLARRLVKFAISLARCALRALVPFVGGSLAARCVVVETAKLIAQQVIGNKQAEAKRKVAIEAAKKSLQKVLDEACELLVDSLKQCIVCDN